MQWKLIQWFQKDSRIYFSRATERRVYFLLTIAMAVFGIWVRLGN